MAKSKAKGKKESGPTEVVKFEAGVNVAAQLEGTKLTLVIDLSQDYGISNKTGRSYRVASTLGNKPIPNVDPAIRLSVNCFKVIPKHLRKPQPEDDAE